MSITSTATPTAEQWEALRAPFEPAFVSFRTTATYERNGEKYGIVAAYIDARDVARRLDSVVGPENWSFDWAPVVTSSKALLVAKGILTICGVTKCDVGDSDENGTEPSKSSVSDALKRAAVLAGIGRYLYDLPIMTAKLEKRGNSWVIPKSEEARLRATLPRPMMKGKKAAAAVTQHDADDSTRADAHADTHEEAPADAAEPVESRARAYPATETHERATSDAQSDLSRALRKAGYTSIAKVEALLFMTLKRTLSASQLSAGKSDITLHEVGRVLEKIA